MANGRKGERQRVVNTIRTLGQPFCQGEIGAMRMPSGRFLNRKGCEGQTRGGTRERRNSAGHFTAHGRQHGRDGVSPSDADGPPSFIGARHRLRADALHTRVC